MGLRWKKIYIYFFLISFSGKVLDKGLKLLFQTLYFNKEIIQRKTPI